MTVFWDVEPCSVVEVYRRFRGACCTHHEGDSLDDRGSKQGPWTLMMETEQVSKTLFFDSKLTRLIAREDFITFMRCESFKSYTGVPFLITYGKKANKKITLV
jgi:hypothetical protein